MSGQLCIGINQDFHFKTLLIKRHLTEKTHPITELIDVFKEQFYKDHIDHLEKQDFLNNEFSQEQRNSFKINTEKVLNSCVKQIKQFIQIITSTIMHFYKIMLRNRDLKKDLLVILATNFILTDEVYFIIFNLFSMKLADDLLYLKKIMKDQRIKEEYFSFDALKIAEQFRFDSEYRSKLFTKHNQVDHSYSSLIESVSDHSRRPIPYLEVIDGILNIIQIDSPMTKLENIYISCTRYVSKALDAFYQNYLIKPAELVVDSETLQSIIIYVTARINYPQIWTEINMMEEFLTDAIQLSSRSMYLVMIRASCEYMLQLDDQKCEKLDNLMKIEIEKEKEKDIGQSEDYQRKGSVLNNGVTISDFRASFYKKEGKKIGVLTQKKNYEMKGVGFRNVTPNVSTIGQKQSKKKDEEQPDAYFFDSNVLLKDDIKQFLKKTQNFGKNKELTNTTIMISGGGPGLDVKEQFVE